MIWLNNSQHHYAPLLYFIDRDLSLPPAPPPQTNVKTWFLTEKEHEPLKAVTQDATLQWRHESCLMHYCSVITGTALSAENATIEPQKQLLRKTSSLFNKQPAVRWRWTDKICHFDLKLKAKWNTEILKHLPPVLFITDQLSSKLQQITVDLLLRLAAVCLAIDKDQYQLSTKYQVAK